MQLTAHTLMAKLRPSEILSFARQNIPLILVIVVTVLAQVGFCLASEPILHPDSYLYKDLSLGILDGKWTGYHFRTPGYPVFLAIVQVFGGRDSMESVVTAQFVLGMFVPVFLFLMYRPLFKSGWIPAACSAIFLMDYVSIGTQSAILTESLTQFLLIGSLPLVVHMASQKTWGGAVLTGLCLAAVFLVRPSFQFLPWFLAIIGIACHWTGDVQRQRRQLLLWWATVALVAQVICWLWSLKVYTETGQFALTTLGGIGFLSHTAPIADRAPQDYSLIKEHITKAAVQRHGDYANIGHPVLQSVHEATGRAYWDISKDFQDMSVWLVIHNPGFYSRSLLRSLRNMMIESASYIFIPSSISNYMRQSPVWRTIYGITDVYYWRRPQRLLVTPFVLMALFAGAIFVRRKDRNAILVLSLTMTVVCYNVFLHAALITSELGRYRLVVQPLYLSLMIACAGIIVGWIFEKLKKELSQETRSSSVLRTGRKSRRESKQASSRKSQSNRRRNS